MKMKNDVYFTRDLYEAAFLYISSLNFLGLSSEPGSLTFYFRFEDREKAGGISAEFWNKKAEGNIKEYADAIHTLKDLVFSKKRGNGNGQVGQGRNSAR